MAVPTGLSRTTGSGILMRMYPEKKVWNAINRNMPVSSRLKRRMWSVSEGTDFRVNVLTQFSDGGGDRSEWDRIPSPDSNSHIWGSFNFARYDRTIRLSGEMMEETGSIVDPLADEMDLSIPAARLDCERSIFLGYEGDLCDIVSTTSATSIVVSSWQWIRVGMKVDVLIKSTGVEAFGVVGVNITAIVRSTDDSGQATLTLASPGLGTFGSVNTTYSLFRTNGWRKNFHGLKDIVSTTDPTGQDYGSLDRDTPANEAWKAQTLSNNSDSISGHALANLATRIELDGNGMMPTVFWVHPYVHNDLIKLARRDARFPGGVRQFEQWGNTVFIDQTPVLRSRFCPFDTAYALHEPSFRWAHPKSAPNGRWRRSGGRKSGTVLLPVPGYWGWEALWVWRKQLVCSMPNAQGSLTDIKWGANGTV